MPLLVGILFRHLLFLYSLPFPFDDIDRIKVPTRFMDYGLRILETPDGDGRRDEGGITLTSLDYYYSA